LLNQEEQQALWRVLHGGRGQPGPLGPGADWQDYGQLTAWTYLRRLGFSRHPTLGRQA